MDLSEVDVRKMLWSNSQHDVITDSELAFMDLYWIKGF